MTWRFRTWTEWREVWSDGCQEVWRELYAADPLANPFQRPEVVRAWAETAGAEAGAAAAVVLATHGSGARVLLPAVVAPHRGRLVTRRVLESAGQSLFGYQSPLVAVGGAPLAGADWSGFWEGVRRQLAPRCDQALLRAIEPDFAAGRWSEPSGDDSPVLDLQGVHDMDDLLERCSANHRGDVRRMRRRLAERGEVELWTAREPDAAGALADFRDRFAAAYDAVWAGRPYGSLLRRPGLLAFLGRLVTEGIPGGFTHYAALRVAGTPVAWHLGLQQEGQLYWWFPAYDPAWEGFSPGKTLLAKVIESGIENGLRRLHFLTGGQPYKLRWKPESHELNAVRWHSPTVRGSALAFYDWRALHPAIKTSA